MPFRMLHRMLPRASLAFLPPPPALPTHPQVKYILGLKLPRSDNIQDALSDIFDNLGGFKWREFCMVRGGCAVHAALCARRQVTRLSRALGTPMFPIRPAAPLLLVLQGMAFIFLLLAFQYLSRRYK